MARRILTNRLRPFSKQSILSLGVLVALTGILILLAALQYRWSGQVSEAERERMQKSLNAAARQFQEEFYREIFRVCASFQMEPGSWTPANRKQFVQNYQDWTQTSPHPQLIANLFLWEPGERGDAGLLHLNQATMQFEPMVWPERFENLRQRLAARTPFNPEDPGGPEPPPFAWTMAGEVPALFRQLFQVPIKGADPRRLDLRPQGYVIVELNLEYLQGEFFPSLAQRFFGGPQDSLYQVRIVSRGESPRIIYPPNLEGAGKEMLSGDAVVDLLEPRPEGVFTAWVSGPKEDRVWERSERVRPGLRIMRGAFGFVGGGPRPRPPLFLSGTPSGSWQLVVKHLSGSLEAAVAASRRRNLGISFGILLLLAVSAVMVFVSTMRARHLAMLQMEFVAGVSHELRTPLAVVCSAGHNLATGIVSGSDQTRHYGTLIQSEGSRLSRMVQQILLFASSQSGKARYERRAVQIAEIIDQVLSENAPTLASEGFSLEKQIEPNLPRILGDPVALGHCLQNLISNSIKYSGKNRWIGVWARKTEGARGPEVLVTVKDKGLGIEAGELKDVFRPFYRSKSAMAAQIPGTGLGLRVAESVAQAMGGTLSVESTPGKGSAFTLRLPALKAAAEPEDREVEWGDPEGVSAQKGG